MSGRLRRRQLHQQLLSLLPSAEADSSQVVATFLDIRGFSAFAASSESFDAAFYLRSVYTNILNDFYSDASFFKPTGDGLLLVHDLPPDAAAVPPLVSSILARAVRLVDTFPSLTIDDFMVNFTVPECLGAGVARGAATRLISHGQVLDYTGRCLNLASRLMDKARPSGVVFSDHHADRLMSSEGASLFSRDEGYVRGIAEEGPLAVWVSDTVRLSAEDREPMSSEARLYSTPTTLRVKTVKEEKLPAEYSFQLRRVPKPTERVGVHVRCPRFNREKRRSGATSLHILGTFHQEPAGPRVKIDVSAVLPMIRDMPYTFASDGGKRANTLIEFTGYIEPIPTSE